MPGRCVLNSASSVLELGEIVSGVAMWQLLLPIARLLIQVHHGPQLPPARVTCSRTLLGAWQSWPVRPSPTRRWEVIGFEELLSE